jgi:hypothetical protein
MGNNKDKMEKLEKKRLKQQYKIEKKRRKEEHYGSAIESDTPSNKIENLGRSDVKGARTKSEPKTSQERPELKEKIPWYRNPDWLRAIAAIASLAVAMIALIITLM